jgi:hypothetical protein
MTAGASAAAGKGRTVRLFPHRRRITGKALHATEGKTFFHLDDADEGFLPRKKAGDEDGEALMAANPLHVGTEPFAFHQEAIVLLHPATSSWSDKKAFPILTGNEFVVYKIWKRKRGDSQDVEHDPEGEKNLKNFSKKLKKRG